MHLENRVDLEINTVNYHCTTLFKGPRQNTGQNYRNVDNKSSEN